MLARASKNTYCYKAEQLTYCSNVHSGETVEQVMFNLHTFIKPVRLQRGLATMDSGLWLSNLAAEQLQDSSQRQHFKEALTSAGLQLTSLNGFPYGNFHQQQVKTGVYLPDWSDPARLLYSKNLADILAACLPENQLNGVISTLPLGYKREWSISKQQLAIAHLNDLSEYLQHIWQETGKHIMFCLEMEPDCVLESTDELISFFQDEIKPIIRFNQYLGICYDVCHQAVMFEQAYQSLTQIVSAGIPIGKIQLSSALQVQFNRRGQSDENLINLLKKFCETRYLHQVKTINDQGLLSACDDLCQALVFKQKPTSVFSGKHLWRIHFHVPINYGALLHPQLTTTRDVLLQVFDFLTEHPQIRPCLEVETYSWQVLPKTLRPETNEQLISGLVDELSWVEQQLFARHLLIQKH